MSIFQHNNDDDKAKGTVVPKHFIQNSKLNITIVNHTDVSHIDARGPLKASTLTPCFYSTCIAEVFWLLSHRQGYDMTGCTWAGFDPACLTFKDSLPI